mmetsp:Transcript_150353/g.483194  ORF Transcript_150353/g.483194 Transcript_150353/m.483194 type:complete len:411 (+) Transcript_150353:1057-2289(+)
MPPSSSLPLTKRTRRTPQKTSRMRLCRCSRPRPQLRRRCPMRPRRALPLLWHRRQLRRSAELRASSRAHLRPPQAAAAVAAAVVVPGGVCLDRGAATCLTLRRRTRPWRRLLACGMAAGRWTWMKWFRIACGRSLLKLAVPPLGACGAGAGAANSPLGARRWSLGPAGRRASQLLDLAPVRRQARLFLTRDRARSASLPSDLATVEPRTSPRSAVPLRPSLLSTPRPQVQTPRSAEAAGTSSGSRLAPKWLEACASSPACTARWTAAHGAKNGRLAARRHRIRRRALFTRAQPTARMQVWTVPLLLAKRLLHPRTHPPKEVGDQREETRGPKRPQVPPMLLRWSNRLLLSRGGLTLLLVKGRNLPPFKMDPRLTSGCLLPPRWFIRIHRWTTLGRHSAPQLRRRPAMPRG